MQTVQPSESLCDNSKTPKSKNSGSLLTLKIAIIIFLEQYQFLNKRSELIFKSRYQKKSLLLTLSTATLWLKRLNQIPLAKPNKLYFKYLNVEPKKKNT